MKTRMQEETAVIFARESFRNRTSDMKYSMPKERLVRITWSLFIQSYSRKAVTAVHACLEEERAKKEDGIAILTILSFFSVKFHDS